MGANPLQQLLQTHLQKHRPHCHLLLYFLFLGHRAVVASPPGSALCPGGTQSACESSGEYLNSGLHFSALHFCITHWTTLFTALHFLHLLYLFALHALHSLFRTALHLLHSLFCTSLPAPTFLHLLFWTSLPALACIDFSAHHFRHLLDAPPPFFKDFPLEGGLSWSGVPQGVKFPP